MPTNDLTPANRPLLRATGLVYLTVIATGLWSELAVRARLIDPADATATFSALTANLPLFRLSLAADAVMVLADIALALLFFALLRDVHRDLARAAMALRLIQATTIATALVINAAALPLLTAGDPSQAGLVALIVETHAMGYDIGLIFFGANTLIMAWLLYRSGLVGRWLPPLLAAAGLIYLTGSFLRLLSPDLHQMMLPAYLIVILAETALTLTLIAGGRRAAPPYPRASAPQS